MRSYIAAFVLAMFMAAVLTPLARLFALRIGAFDTPGGRHVHARKIPRLGGLAIAVAASVPLVCLLCVDSGVAHSVKRSPHWAAAILVGGVVMCAVGAADDVRGVRALHKLAAQVFTAVLAFLLGLRIDAVQLPILGELSMGAFALPVTVLWIVGVTNAVNLIDGLDGLAAGVVFFAASTNLIVALISGSVFVAALMASVMGALIGFLVYNFNPARIFMGDSGSYFLGYMLATASLVGSLQKTSTAVALLVPILALGVPIFDTLFSMLRRFLERRPMFSPDRGHLHHRLLDVGLTHRRAVLVLYAVSIIFTLAAIAFALDRSWQGGIALLGGTIILIGLVRFVGYFEYLHARARQDQRLYDRHTERLRKELPTAVERFLRAESEPEIWQELARVGRQSELDYIEAMAADEDLSRRIECSQDVAVAREQVSASFLIGRDANARARLRFVWSSENGDVSAQMDILLQVVTDVVEQALSRVGSELAPLTVTQARELPSGAMLEAPAPRLG